MIGVFMSSKCELKCINPTDQKIVEAEIKNG